MVLNTRDAVLITEAEPVGPPGPRIVYVNPAFTAMTGYPAEEVIGQKPHLLRGPKTDRRQLEKIRAAMKKWQPVRAELVNYRKNGQEFEVEFDMAPVADETGEFTHWVSIQRDVTEREQAAEKLRESEERLRNLIENMPGSAVFVVDHELRYRLAQGEALAAAGFKPEDLVGRTIFEALAPALVWVCDAEGQAIYFNHRWYQYTGQSEAQAAGFGWIETLHPDDSQRILLYWEHCRATGEIYEGEVRYRRNDGEYRWHTFRALPRRGADERIEAWYGVSFDITERKQAEMTERVLAEMRERHRLAQELHDTIAQTLGYLNLKIGMAHTLLASQEVEAAKAHLHELKGVVGEAYTDVREEIFYLRAKVLSDLSFMELLERYVDKYRRFYNLDIQLLQEAEPALFQFSPEVTAQLIRTIQEALINIRKHAGVNTATLRLGRANGALMISIEDAGRGFDPDQGQGQDVGFGLQIMRERVESVGGRLAIDSAPGRGARIVLIYGSRD